MYAKYQTIYFRHASASYLIYLSDASHSFALNIIDRVQAICVTLQSSCLYLKLLNKFVDYTIIIAPFNNNIILYPTYNIEMMATTRIHT